MELIKEITKDELKAELDTIYSQDNNIQISDTNEISTASILTGLSSVTSTSFIGALTGNATTSTKISSITKSNIVQLTQTQTLTNKTL